MWLCVSCFVPRSSEIVTYCGWQKSKLSKKGYGVVDILDELYSCSYLPYFVKRNKNVVSSELQLSGSNSNQSPWISRWVSSGYCITVTLLHRFIPTINGNRLRRQPDTPEPAGRSRSPSTPSLASLASEISTTAFSISSSTPSL